VDDEIHDESDYDNEGNTADMEEVLRDRVGDNLRDVLRSDPSEPKPTTQFEIASMQHNMEEKHEMPYYDFQQNTQSVCV
jgi:hypothetical protein